MSTTAAHLVPPTHVPMSIFTHPHTRPTASLPNSVPSANPTAPHPLTPISPRKCTPPLLTHAITTCSSQPHLLVPFSLFLSRNVHASTACPPSAILPLPPPHPTPTPTHPPPPHVHTPHTSHTCLLTCIHATLPVPPQLLRSPQSARTSSSALTSGSTAGMGGTGPESLQHPTAVAPTPSTRVPVASLRVAHAAEQRVAGGVGEPEHRYNPMFAILRSRASATPSSAQGNPNGKVDRLFLPTPVPFAKLSCKGRRRDWVAVLIPIHTPVPPHLVNPDVPSRAHCLRWWS